MTETTLLDERAVEEIEARRARCLNNKNQSRLAEASILISSDIPALCDTVKHLRQRIQILESQWCECGHTKDRHGFFSDHDECYECDQASSDLCCEWRPLARPEQLQSQLEQLGADVLVKARNDTVKYLESQLEQLRAENERLSLQLKDWQEEEDTKAGYL